MAFPQLSQTLRSVAADAGVRFLDLSRATEGREACSRVLADEEWQRRLTVDPNALVYGGLDAFGIHLAQESFHPSAAGHAELGRCSGSSCGRATRPRACRVGADGHLHAGAPRLPGGGRLTALRAGPCACRAVRAVQGGGPARSCTPSAAGAHGAPCARRPGDLHARVAGSEDG